MAITSVLINVADVDRSVRFYTAFLGAVPIEQSEDAAVLDAVTATLRLHRIASPTDSSWVGDDLQRGFRHIGFKVSDLDARVAVLKDGGVRFTSGVIDAEGGVRIIFFYDPDGTLVELVEGPLQYHVVYDQAAVDSDWGLGDPDRPRFDHVAETVADAHATHEYYADLGYTLMGGIHQPHDARGFEITFLRHGDSSLEIFEFGAADTRVRAPQLDGLGFVAVELEGEPPAAAEHIGDSDGYRLFADLDGLIHAARGA